MLRIRIYTLAGIVALVMSTAGCVSHEQKKFTGIETAPVELTSTSFHPQSKNQCGPAALATILESSGLDLSADDLSREVYLPGREGTLQLEIISAVRRHGRVPYQPDGTLPSLVDQLQHGLPILVLLNLGLDIVPTWHYAVVIGYQPASDIVILRSGTDYRLQMPGRRFERAWDKSERWALLALRPGQLPANVDIERYLDALIAIEETGNWRTAEAGYRAVLTHSPDNTLALFGLANTLRADGQLESAVQMYQNLLRQDPGHLPARNNLADTLLVLEHCEEATEVINGVDLALATPSIASKISTTKTEILSKCELD